VREGARQLAGRTAKSDMDSLTAKTLVTLGEFKAFELRSLNLKTHRTSRRSCKLIRHSADYNIMLSCAIILHNLPV